LKIEIEQLPLEAGVVENEDIKRWVAFARKRELLVEEKIIESFGSDLSMMMLL
jgi:NADPH-dependent 7-cyano-7-deazaguanine reductase QueF